MVVISTLANASKMENLW